MWDKLVGIGIVKVDRIRQLYPTVYSVLNVQLEISLFVSVTLLALPVWHHQAV